MSKYAYYDHTIKDRVSHVLGWYITELNPKNLPPMEDLLQLTDEQWEQHGEYPLRWGVLDGELVEDAPPPITLPVEIQAGIDKMTRIGQGMTVTNFGVFALDEASIKRLGDYARDAAVFDRLPGGKNEFVFEGKTVTKSSLIVIYHAAVDLLASLEQQCAIAASGKTPEWPSMMVNV